jgi:serine/threonine protein phosphatase PrpC
MERFWSIHPKNKKGGCIALNAFPGHGGHVIVEAWVKSDVGKQRTTNEDCYYLDPNKKLILVLDGMGGHRAGEVASRLAMETFVSFYNQFAEKEPNIPEEFENYDPNFTFRANLLRQAAFTANRAVLEKSLLDEQFVGMGSTVIGMAIEDFMVSMINVGDSRMYLVRSGSIEQISKDHTLAEDQVERGIMSREEAQDSQLRHILSSVIGVDSRVRVHMDEFTVFPGDMFVLCTDGLTAVMNELEILEEVLGSKPGPDTIDRILEEVNRRGSPDNTTLALVLFQQDDSDKTEVE